MWVLQNGPLPKPEPRGVLAHSDQRGLSLIEVLAALAILAVALPIVASLLDKAEQTVAARGSAQHMKEVGKAYRQYVLDNFQTLKSNAPTTIAFADLTSGGYLPSNFTNRNAWRQSYVAGVWTTGSDSLHLLAATQGGEGGPGEHEFANQTMSQTAALVGARGGFTPTDNNPYGNSDTVVGAHGGWQLPLSDPPSGAQPEPGHLAWYTVLDPENIDGRYLHREEQPGQPELNTMETTLRMAENDVGAGEDQGVGRLNFEGQVDDGGSEVSPKAKYNCGTSEDTEGGLYFDPNDGLYLCRDGEERRLLDSENSLMVKTMTLADHGGTITKPDCSGDTPNPRIFLTPARFEPGNSGKTIKGVHTWADDNAGDWTVYLNIKTDQGWGPPSAPYDKLQVVTACKA